MKKISYKNIFIESIVLFVLIFVYYVLVSNGLGNKPFYLQLRRFIPMSILLVLTINILKAFLPPQFFISFSFTSFLWFSVFPIAYKLTFYKNMPFFSNHFDIVFAIYSFIGLTLLSVILTKYLKSKITAIIISTIQFILIIIPISQIIYYIYYKTCISEAAIMAIFQTNPGEAKEFILQSFGYLGIFSIIILFFSIYSLIYRLNFKNFKLIGNNLDLSILNKKSKVFIAVVAIATSSYSFYTAFPQTGLMTMVANVKNYFVALEKFNIYHIDKYKNLIVHKPGITFSKPSTIIMVIGECASKDYMSAFSDTKNNTTPWLLEQKANPNFILYPHAYTSRVQTVPALERALTEKNQYNNIEFNQSITIIDIAKKAGYYTSWFSNQGTIDIADTPITLVGKTADTAKWTNQDSDTAQYDGSLLKYLKTVDKTKNNFIIFHFMGSHDNYQNRYPIKFAKWGDPTKNEPILNYDNSLYYSDYVLSEIYNYSKSNLNLQAMVYFSDHGTVPDWKRHPDFNPFTANRIPLFIYLSDEYKSTYPQTAETLKNHSNKYFTNDLIYDMMCGIFNISSPNYDETQSIASPKYKFTQETLRTNLGKTPLTEDK